MVAPEKENEPTLDFETQGFSKKYFFIIFSGVAESKHGISNSKTKDYHHKSVK